MLQLDISIVLVHKTAYGRADYTVKSNAFFRRLKQSGQDDGV